MLVGFNIVHYRTTIDEELEIAKDCYDDIDPDDVEEG
jgi:hypothetical protein